MGVDQQKPLSFTRGTPGTVSARWMPAVHVVLPSVVQCISCFDSCVQVHMHPQVPLPARLSPKADVCKLCWSCKVEHPVTKHLATCPAIFELGAALSSNIRPMELSLQSCPPDPDLPFLPCPLHLTMHAINSIMGKRAWACASNQRSPDGLCALASSKVHKWEQHHGK